MASVLRVDDIQRSSGSSYTNTFVNAAGQIINRPQFMAVGTWGSYTMNFSSASQTSFTNTSSGYTTYPAFNNVSGINTTGFTTASSAGLCKYRIPLTGIYTFSFSVLVDTTVSSHLDSTFNVSDSNDTFVANIPWGAQYIGDSATSTGVCGFNRIQEVDGIYFAPWCTVTGRFYEGQHIRPMLGMNAAVAASIYHSNHNYWHGAYIGN